MTYSASMAHDRGELHQDDLAWAGALATGDRVALTRYEQQLVPMITAQLSRRGFTSDQIDDVQQTLRARLFVGDGDGPAIVGYRGAGSLRSWVLVAALREAVRQRQKSAREPATEGDALLDLAHRSDALVGDGLVKQRYRDLFRAAFRKALAELTPRDRNLLRLHLIDELAIDQIGALQGVHRATAARWIEQAREHVSKSVRRDLMEQLGADPFEADEVLKWVQSRIDVSLSGLAK